MGIRTGQDYRDSIRDGREVWIAGERVDDVTEHPAFARTVDSVAAIYDLQHREDRQDALTMVSPATGDRVSRAYKIPASTNDLIERRELVEQVARTTGGTMGRLPEYGAAFALGLLNLSKEFGRVQPGSESNIETWFERCQEGDVSLATSFVDPQVDRSKSAEEVGLLRIVEHRPDGIVITGCKSVATFGPLCNEFLIITAPRRFNSADEVLYLSVPASSEGLRFFCRSPLGINTSRFDGPLSSRFDEPDAWALFDNVFVPADRVFLAGGADFSKVAGYFGQILGWPWYHNLIRISVKADLLAGVCTLLTEYLNTWQYPQVQESVSETIEYAETIRAFLRAAEEDCVITAGGIAMPNPSTITVAKLFAVKGYPRLLEIVRELAGQGIIMAPAEANLDNPELGPLLRPYFTAYEVDAVDRIRLFRLAWDLACDSFAGRQTLFELFNAGGLTVSRLGVANGVDKTRYVELAKQLAGIGEPETAEQGLAARMATQ